MYLSLYTGSLSNSLLKKLLILLHLLLYFFSVSSYLTMRFIHLLFSSKYLAYTFTRGSFIGNVARKTLPLFIYPIKYSSESKSPYDYLSEKKMCIEIF